MMATIDLPPPYQAVLKRYGASVSNWKQNSMGWVLHVQYAGREFAVLATSPGVLESHLEDRKPRK